jgi:hypothetical protein
MSFYIGQRPVSARQAFNLFQTKLHDKNPSTNQTSGVSEGAEDWEMRVQSLPRTSELKLKAITATSPGPMPKRYTFDTEKEAIQHFGQQNWQFIKSGTPDKYGDSWKVEYKKVDEAKPKLTDSADPFGNSFGKIRYALSPGIAKQYGIDGDTYHKLAKMAMDAKQWMERGLHYDQVVRKMNIPDDLKQTIRDGIYDIKSMAFIMGVQQYQEEQNSMKESRVLGRGMSPEARARDIEQSDIEYIEQRQFKEKWKKDNPGKPWPGYEKAGRYK